MEESEAEGSGERTPNLGNIALELLYLIIADLTPRDLVHLMGTSHSLHDSILPMLYGRDARGNNTALRWASHYSEPRTLRRCLEQFGSPASAYFPDGQHPAVSWNLYRKTFGLRVLDRTLPCPPLGDFYDTALITAIRRNHAGAVRVLLARGADANQPDRTPVPRHRSRWFPLHWALEHHEVIFKRDGRDVTISTNRSGGQLRTGDVEIVRLLLAAGARPNQLTVGAAAGPDGKEVSDAGERVTALDCAVRPAVPAEAVEELIRAGADPSIPSRWPSPHGRAVLSTPLDVILASAPTALGVRKAQSLLLRRPGANGASLTSRAGVPVLMSVIDRWIPRRWRPGIQMETVLRLLRSILASDPAQANTVAASASALELEGQTALRLAANKETTMRLAPLLQLLLASGADPALRDADGATALHYAASFGRLDRLTALLAHDDDDDDGDGAARPSPDLPDAQGWTPLHYAAQFFDRPQGPEQASIATALLRAGADPSRRAKDGLTPLEVAFRAGNVDVARVLLREMGGRGGIEGKVVPPPAPVVVHSLRTEPEALQALVYEGVGAGDDSGDDTEKEGPFIGPRNYDSLAAVSENLVVHVRRGVRVVARMLGMEGTTEHGRCRVVIFQPLGERGTSNGEFGTVFLSARKFTAAVEDKGTWSGRSLNPRWEEEVSL